MKTARITAEFDADIERVWDIVTDLDAWTWRSDLSGLRKIDDSTFVEVDESGIETTFTITTFTPFERYEFDLDNNNIYGHWTGTFTQTKGKTTIEFTEDIEVKKKLMSLMVGGYLKKQQQRYIDDLHKELTRRSAAQ